MPHQHLPADVIGNGSRWLHSPQRLASLLLAGLLAGCSVMGPSAIHSSRLSYNEAITETNNQQILMVMVHNRYGERGSLLNVASVTANVRVTTSAAIQAGFGDTSNYDGNLVPFSGGVVYEENPIISYVPVEGEKYLRQLSSPLPLYMLAQISRSAIESGAVFTALLTSVNGIYNPAFPIETQDDDPRFDRFVEIMNKLMRSHHLHWAESPHQKTRFSLVIDRSAPTQAAMVAELLALLGIPEDKYQGKQVIIPVSMALDSADTDTIAFTTRSVLDLVQILSASIEVPAIDEQEGVAATFPQPGRSGRHLKVSYSETQPERAYVAVKHREGWFYIDERDRFTKAYFKLLVGLWSMSMSSATQAHSAPVLTVPVGGR